MTSWDIVQWQAALSIAETILTLVMIIAMLYLRATFATKKEVGEVKIEVFNVLGRVDRVENDLKHVPTAGVIAELREDFARMTGEHKGLREALESTARGVERIEDYLMGKK